MTEIRERVMHARWPILVAMVVASLTAAVRAQVAPAVITVESPVMRDGQPMPVEYTADGRNVSPSLTWRGVPPGAKELVVVMTNEDHVWTVPSPVPLMHWVMYGIKPGVTGLAEGMPVQEILPAPPDLAGAFQAHTTFDANGYRGPQPPPGQTQRYRFRVVALDRPIDLPPGSPASQVWQAMEGHIIGEGSLTVSYARTPRPVKKPIV